jgi:transposase InsO family protein
LVWDGAETLLGSMGTLGDCYHNTAMESLRGLDADRTFGSIEHFYSSDRRHGSLGYLIPNEFEG